MNKNHNINLYNTLLDLSRNILFYKTIKLEDSFETRIYLMFIHFSIIMISFKKKGIKFDQKSYDLVFNYIENDLRELGFGDVSVNKKMKDLNKILYDILLKIEKKNGKKFTINENLVFNYFKELNDVKSINYQAFERYFTHFYKFCYEQTSDNMIREALNFKNNYGST